VTPVVAFIVFVVTFIVFVFVVAFIVFVFVVAFIVFVFVVLAVRRVGGRRRHVDTRTRLAKTAIQQVIHGDTCLFQLALGAAVGHQLHLPQLPHRHRQLWRCGLRHRVPTVAHHAGQSTHTAAASHLSSTRCVRGREVDLLRSRARR
jgi:hypothetical protein